jgi:hypothetical protein
MIRIRPFVAVFAVALALALSGCYGDTEIGNGLHHVTLRGGVLTAHVSGQPDAVVTAEGDLSIGGKPVAVTPTQRELLKKYFGSVVAVRQAGIETGKAGAAMAGHALGEVARGLANGDPDQIGSRIDDRAKEVERKALVICDSLESLRTTQDAIAASLPAFKPYATIDSGDVTSCHGDNIHKRSS